MFERLFEGRSYEVLYDLKEAPEKYRRNKNIERKFKVQIISKWDEGGWAPWQAYLPVKFRGVPYTIYLRERHDILSLKVMWGHVTDFKDKRKYYGFLGFFDILSEEDHEKIGKGEVELFELAEEIGAKYIYDMRNFLPTKRR